MLASRVLYELCIWLAHGVPEANRIRYELSGWLMTFLGKLATCALQREMGMSSVAGQWHSSGNWLHELASRILYELCGWPMTFLRQVELEMSYVAC